MGLNPLSAELWARITEARAARAHQADPSCRVSVSEDMAANLGQFMTHMNRAAQLKSFEERVNVSDPAAASRATSRFTRIGNKAAVQHGLKRAIASGLSWLATENRMSSHEAQAEKEGRIRLRQWSISRRMSTGIAQHSISGKDGSKSQYEPSQAHQHTQARKVEEEEELSRYLAEAQDLALLLCVAHAGVGVCFGAYDVMSFYYSLLHDVRQSNVQLYAMLITRYAGLVAPLLLLRQGIRSYQPKTLRHTSLTAALLAILPAMALIGILLLMGPELHPCPPAQLFRPCQRVSVTATATHDATTASNPWLDSTCFVGNFGGVDYCEAAPLSHATTLLILHAFLPYSYTFASLGVLTVSAGTASCLSLVAFATSQHIVHFDAARPTPLSVVDWLLLLLWVGLAHSIGVLHKVSRRTDLWEKSALRLRQARVLRAVEEEQERCKQILANILPPHLLGTLGAVALGGKDAAGSLATGAPTLGRGVLVCESYEGCSFLFAKIIGLSSLVQNEDLAPAHVLITLQTIFDRFDALADMYGVQKVRKTANEYYLAAAGLPDPTRLPSPEDRAAGIAAYAFAMISIMHVVNLELARYGIHFGVQVGIHSGNAIAGVIGRKTVQYDLCGDAVNTAARMCSYSAPGHVHCSHATFQLLQDKYGACCRGEMDVKGKGRMRTYFLVNLPAGQREVAIEHRGPAAANGQESVAQPTTELTGNPKLPVPLIPPLISGDPWSA